MPVSSCKYNDKKPVATCQRHCMQFQQQQLQSFSSLISILPNILAFFPLVLFLFFIIISERSTYPTQLPDNYPTVHACMQYAICKCNACCNNKAHRIFLSALRSGRHHWIHLVHVQYVHLLFFFPFIFFLSPEPAK